MKTHPYSAVAALLILAAASALAAETPAPARPTPQPRVRLLSSAQGSVARLESAAPASDVVAMDRVTVAGSKVPAEPSRAEAPEPTRFSFTEGGPLSFG